MKSLQLAQPHLLMLVGIPGSGKSFFAEKFATTFGAPSVAIERVRPFTVDDAGARIVIAEQIKELVKTQRTIIIDGITETRAERVELGHIAHAAGYETLLIWVQTDPATAKARALKPGKDTSKIELTSDEYDQVLSCFAPPNQAEKSVVISGKHTYASQAKVVLKKLSEPRPSPPRENTLPARPRSGSIRRNITVR